MAQNYTEQLRKDNVRDAIYEDAQNNFEALRTSWSGTDFPENPKVGQSCYRTDEDKLYYWDGYRWSQKGGGGSSELKSMELPAIETERVSIVLEGARCLDKNMMFVFVDKIAQDPSTYSMNDDGTVVNFSPAIPANAAVTLRWFDTDVGTFDTAVFSTDDEWKAGTATNKAPNVKQARTGLVTTDTAQNITAGKNFVNNTTSTNIDAHTSMSITLKNTQAELGVDTMNADGSVNFKYQGIRTVDKNNEEVSYLYSAPDGVGGSFTRLGASTKVNGEYADAFIDIEVDANGKGHLYIPDVDTDSTVSGTQAATKKYVDGLLNNHPTRNVGDVFYTARKDASLNGAVPADGSIYNVSDFSGENAVPALLAAGKLPYISMAEYEERLAAPALTYSYYQGVLHDDGMYTSNPYGRVYPSFNPDYQQYDTWEFRTRFYWNGRGGTNQHAILGFDANTDYKAPFFAIKTNGDLFCCISSNGSSWNIANGANVGKTLTADVWYDLVFGFDGASYYFRWKEATQSDAEWTTSWTLANATKSISAAPMILMDHKVTADWDLRYWNGSLMFMPQTMFTANGVVVWRGNAPKRPQKSCNVFGWDGEGSSTFRVPMAEKPKRVLVAKKEVASESEQTWWNLYSDGWLEQGDFIWGTNVSNQTINSLVDLPRPFKDMNYTVMTVSEGGTSNYLYSGVGMYPKNKGGFCLAHAYYGRYIACGYAEVPTEAEYQFQNIEAQRAMVQVATGNTDAALVTATSVIPRMNRLEERFQIVNELPANPDSETFYFVINQGG